VKAKKTILAKTKKKTCALGMVMVHKLFPYASRINIENCLMHSPDCLAHPQIA
jgi:hypothetical protein